MPAAAETPETEAERLAELDSFDVLDTVPESTARKQRIVPDEAAYRALIVACGRTNSDRRVELVKLFGLLRSDGIFPSAVTLGQYTRALAEGYSKRAAAELPESDGIGVEVSESMSMVRGSGTSRRSSTSGSSRQ